MYYGKLENGKLVPFVPYRGGLQLKDCIIFNPRLEHFLLAGYYPVIELIGEGNDFIQDNELFHYIRNEELSLIDIINNTLNDSDELLEAVERLIALLGITAKDRTMAMNRISLRDSLNKLVQSESGNGTAWDPYKWNDGDSVIAGYWYTTPSDYLWEAIKSGIPSSELDATYFDIIL